jgi:formiminotetrahydrofolate cyclodeaminase
VLGYYYYIETNKLMEEREEEIMLADMTIKEFLEKTASSDPAPGGGSVAALCGALACALNSMVASLTVNNKEYAEVCGEMKQMMEAGSGLMEFFVAQMDADAEAFNGVMDAYRMPKTSERERAARSEAIQQGLRKAAEVPMGVAEKALEVMDMIETAVGKGNRHAVTDGAIAAMLARTAVLAALYNTEINLASIKDEMFREEMRSRVLELKGKAITREKHILGKVVL